MSFKKFLLPVCLFFITSAQLLADNVPQIAAATKNYSYELNIPYLEYQQTTDKTLAFALSLGSDDLSRFVIQSYASVTVDTQSAQTPLLYQDSQGQWQFFLPYLQVSNSENFYSVLFNLQDDFSTFHLTEQINPVFDSDPENTPFEAQLTPIEQQQVQNLSIMASTRLQLQWTASLENIDHFEISSLALDNQRETRIYVGSEKNQYQLTQLRADTEYQVRVYACLDPACTHYQKSTTVSARTGREVWQLQGEGHSTQTLLRPVSDGNSKFSAARIGPDAGTTNANSVQLYYGPMPIQGQKSTLAVATEIVSDSTDNKHLNFQSLAFQSGLISPQLDEPNTTDEQNRGGNTQSMDSYPIVKILTGQAVPLSSGKIRLFFEAQDSNGITQIYALDSQDGYMGLDFNRGQETVCEEQTDYQNPDACAPALIIGSEQTDAIRFSKIKNARQHKIGYPTQKDWRWDEAAGTFMVFTTDKIKGCSKYKTNHGYAVWDGISSWQVQYDDDGCPKLFQSAQACQPVHLGDRRYKMYCSNPSIKTGKIESSDLPFLGPKKVYYADASTTGEMAYVDFEDWQIQQPREVIFLWPDGTQLDNSAEGYIDDYFVLAPEGDLNYQLMYLAITDGKIAPIAATAILLNP